MTLEEAIKKIQPLDEEAMGIYTSKMEYTWKASSQSGKARRNGDTVCRNLPG